MDNSVITGDLRLIANDEPMFGDGTLQTASNIIIDSGYIELNDITAPANPGAAKGLLYKKAGNDGCFWKPDAAGPEVDLTDGGGGSSGMTIQEQSVDLVGTPHTTLNFLGTRITAADAGAGVASVTVAMPTTTKGDLMVHNGTDDTRLPVGTNDYVLTADSAQATGLAWKISTGSPVIQEQSVDLAGAPHTTLNFLGTRITAADAGAGVASITVAMPTTTKGDLMVHNGTDDTRLPVGTNDYVLTADSAQATGLLWKAVADSSLIIKEQSVNLANTPHTALNFLGTRITAADAGAGVASITVAMPTTTKGDLMVHNGTDDTRLPVGTNDYVLTADSAQATGLLWKAVADSSLIIKEQSVNLANTPHTALNFLGTRITAADAGAGVASVTVAMPTTTKGDLMVHNGTDDTRLPVGTNNYVLTADSAQATGLAWKVGGGSSLIIKEQSVNLANTPHTALNFLGTRITAADAGAGVASVTVAMPTTTKGDLMVHNGTDDTRLPVGTNNYVLTADSAQSTGLIWRQLLGQTAQDIQGASASTTTSTNSTSYVDLNNMTLTASNSGTANYLVVFSQIASCSSDDSSRRYNVILNVAGANIAVTERSERPTNSNSPFIVSTSHYVANIANGSIIKIRWKATGSMTISATNRELTILGFATP